MLKVRADLSVPGKVIVHDIPEQGWQKETRYVRIPVTTAEATAVRNAIGATQTTPPNYQVSKHNCATWGSNSLSRVSDVLDELNKSAHSPIVTPKDLLDALQGVPNSQEHLPNEEVPTWVPKD
jgi:hypothetical protein